jgi:hypothetical protein
VSGEPGDERGSRVNSRLGPVRERTRRIGSRFSGSAEPRLEPRPRARNPSPKVTIRAVLVVSALGLRKRPSYQHFAHTAHRGGYLAGSPGAGIFSRLRSAWHALGLTLTVKGGYGAACGFCSRGSDLQAARTLGGTLAKQTGGRACRSVTPHVADLRELARRRRRLGNHLIPSGFRTVSSAGVQSVL